MSSNSHRHDGLRCCAIVPPHILEHLSRAPGAGEKQRALAFNTLKAMDSVHRAREGLGFTAFASFSASSPFGDRQLAAPQPLIPSYVYSEIANAEDISEETKAHIKLNIERLSALQSAGRPRPPKRPFPGPLFRVVRDAHQTDEQTGDIVIGSVEERETSKDDGAKRVWDFLGQIFEFFSHVYGRNSVDNKGLHLIASVHWDDDNGITPGFMNAFWDPRTSEWYFGDGDGVIFDDFTKSLDVAAHEYSHAVTQFTANLPYQWQSGALNEHFSDVFGSLIKQFYLRQEAGQADWLIGQGIFLSDKAPALRSMKAPGTAYDWPEVIGKDPQPADMDGYHELPMSTDNGGVHIYSGIPNRAFYLVASAFGGNAWEKAGRIWYETLVDPAFNALFDPNRVHPESLEKNAKGAFKLMADLTCKHAEQLFGQIGVELVRQAWNTVKVQLGHATPHKTEGKDVSLPGNIMGRQFIARGHEMLSRSPPPVPTSNLDTSIIAHVAIADKLEFMVRQQIARGGVLTCSLAWELRSCVDLDLSGNHTLDSFLTITGNASNAYATTCGDWIQRNWGDLGMSVLKVTGEALLHGTSSSEYLSIQLNDLSDATEYAKASIRHTNADEAVAIVQTLAWLAATFRPPKENCLSSSFATASLRGNYIQISLEALVEAQGDPSTSCWHSLLGSTVIAEGFHTETTGGGLELPLPLMLELTGMIYSTGLSESPSPTVEFFTGVHSILYPTKRDDARGILTWHYAASDNVMTPPNDGTCLRARQADLDGMRTVLGYTPNVQVNLGTQSRLQQYAHMGKSRAHREKDNWSFTWDGFTAQAGFAGSSVSFPFKFLRRKGQQAAAAAHPTYDQIIRGTAEKPVILYDTADTQETAWLVPQLSVILDLVLLQAHRETLWNELGEPVRAALHAIPDWNGGLAAKKVLDDYTRANIPVRISADNGNPIAIKDLVMQIFTAMSIRTQLDRLHPPSTSLMSAPLLGWDLVQLTDVVDIPRRLQIDFHRNGLNRSTPSWLPLARDVPVFFCDNLGDIMTSAVPLCSRFQRNRKYLVASLHTLRTKVNGSSLCDHYHMNTSDQLVWQLPRDDYFLQCCHGTHLEKDARAKFDDGVQSMIPQSYHRCERLDYCPIIPEEGAVVFGKRGL